MSEQRPGYVVGSVVKLSDAPPKPGHAAALPIDERPESMGLDIPQFLLQETDRTAPAMGPDLPPATQQWRLALPWPPSANRYWRSIVIAGQKHAQTYVGDEGKAYRKLLSELAMVHRWPRALAGPIAIDMIAFPPDRRARDLDNLWKALLDALKVPPLSKKPSRRSDLRAGVFVDDSQIADLRIRRGCVVAGGLLHLVLRTIPMGAEPNAGAWPR